MALVGFSAILNEVDIWEVKISKFLLFSVDPYDEVYELMEEHQSMLEADARIEGVDVQRKSPFEFWNQKLQWWM